MKSAFYIIIALSLFGQVHARGNGEGFTKRKLACEQKEIGDVCTFEGKDSEVNGKCQKGRRGGDVLFCKGAKHGKKGFAILKQLDLSEEQVEKVKKFMLEHRAKKKQIAGEDRKASRDKMKALFIAGKSDAEFKKLHEEISKQHTARGSHRLEKMIFLKNILTDDQRKTFIELGGDKKGRGSKDHRGHR